MARTARKKTTLARNRLPPDEPMALPIEARRHPLVAVIDRELRRCGVGTSVRQRPTNVVIGVSGGADSTALLLACAAIARRANKTDALVEPIAAHVHHHLRPSADDDAQWVSELCQRFGIELHVRHVRPTGLRGNLSSIARQLRYKALVDVANKRGAQFVAVAHHAEDQLETMLMALCRGTGVDGLAGMASVRELDERVNLIRPLLRVGKSQCEDLCRAANIQWQDDPSNADTNRVRARLRRDVGPVLEELWPGAARRAGMAAQAIGAANDTFQRWLNEAFGDATKREWDRDSLRRLPVVTIAAGLRRAALCIAPEVADKLDQDHLLDAAHAIADDVRRPRTFDWPSELTCSVKSKLVKLEMRTLRTHEQRRRT